MLLPKGERLRIPSDLWGVNVLTFDSNRKDGNLQAAVGPASNDIRKLMAAVSCGKAEIPEELEIPIWSDVVCLARAREKQAAIEESGECSTEDLRGRFSQYSEGELHYRLEQLGPSCL